MPWWRVRAVRSHRNSRFAHLVRAALGLQDRALVVERREERGQLVEVRGQLVRLVRRGDLGEGLAELVQVQAQRPLGRGQRQLRVRRRGVPRRPALRRIDWIRA